MTIDKQIEEARRWLEQTLGKPYEHVDEEAADAHRLINACLQAILEDASIKTRVKEILDA